MSLLNKFSKKSNVSKKDAVAETKTAAKVRTPKKTETPVVAGAKSGAAYRVIIKPLASEKAAIAESHRSYTFVVNSHANKTDVKRAVSSVYGVVPQKVRIIRLQGKEVRFGAYFGRRSDIKKAIVTLKKGDSIRVHEGV